MARQVTWMGLGMERQLEVKRMFLARITARDVKGSRTGLESARCQICEHSFPRWKMGPDQMCKKCKTIPGVVCGTRLCPKCGIETPLRAFYPDLIGCLFCYEPVVKKRMEYKVEHNLNIGLVSMPPALIISDTLIAEEPKLLYEDCGARPASSPDVQIVSNEDLADYAKHLVKFRLNAHSDMKRRTGLLFETRSKAIIRYKKNILADGIKGQIFLQSLKSGTTKWTSENIAVVLLFEDEIQKKMDEKEIGALENLYPEIIKRLHDQTNHILEYRYNKVEGDVQDCWEGFQQLVNVNQEPDSYETRGDAKKKRGAPGAVFKLNFD